MAVGVEVPLREVDWPAAGIEPYEVCASLAALNFSPQVEGQALEPMRVDLELRAPTLDDVFLTKTGRTLEGAAEEAETVGEERG